jgi:hypothetical protein
MNSKSHDPTDKDWDRDHFMLPGMDGAPLALRFL